MSVREDFINELSQLKDEILRLGAMVETAFEKTIKSIKTKQYTILDEIIENDKVINDLELTINEKATLLIARQQPVASDLRKIIVCLKVSSDLERMGDLSVDMAKAGKRLLNNEFIGLFEKDLIVMAAKTKEMLRDVLKAYCDSDVLEAQKIAAVDDQIDKAYGEFVQSIFKVAPLEHDSIENITQLAFISRYIERIADYCTNIAEWIIYEVNGKRFDLN